jgi:hypothetical protein
MPLPIGSLAAHPQSEVLDPCTAAGVVLSQPLTVDTHGRRFHVEWDPHAPVTPLGQLVFFSQFLANAGLFRDWVQACPLVFTSNNAPLLPDLLGTITLAILAGQNRYAHLTALRTDSVNPQGLGMSKVCSEDSVRAAPLPPPNPRPARPGRPARCNKRGGPRCACRGFWIWT